MEFKTNIYLLNKDELKYELAVRGIVMDDATVVEMRRTLREVRKFEFTPEFVTPKYPFTFDEDKTASEVKIKEITDALKDFSDTSNSATFKKLASKIAFTISRLNRSQPNPTQGPERSKLLVSLISLASQLKNKAKQFIRSTSTANQSVLGLDESEIDSSDSSSETDDVNVSSVRTPTVTPTIKPIPVSKWNLTFSGDARETSVNAFLERVEETRIARAVSKDILFVSALDLFHGKALIWYRANKSTFTNWDELTTGLREEFQPPDYDDRLQEEVKRRTQGTNESIGMYVSVMKNLFSRFSSKKSETAQLKIIMRNLLPFYQTQLALTDVQSIPQLLKLGRQLEARRVSVESYVPPPNRNKTMESDLAYVEAKLDVASVSDERRPNVSSNRVCWNCNQSGHLATACQRPKKRYCYRCGKTDVTVATCPKCSGNARRAQ